MTKSIAGAISRGLRPAALTSLLALVFAPIGCSFSKSSESISKSISSPFTSMSKSSSPEDAYGQDVRDVTAAYIKSGGTLDDLKQEIGKQAKDHGITNWEESEATYRGVGAGLAKAGYEQSEVNAFKKNFAQTPEQADWLQDGYDSER